MNNMTSEIVLYHNENLTQSTLSQTSNYDNDCQGTIYRHSVPKKLLPLENENMNNNWGAASFSYAHILCPETFSVKEARILTDKIQKRGNEWSFVKIRLANGKECWLGIKNDRMTSMQLSVYHKPNHAQEVQHSRSNRTHSQSQGPQRQNIQGNEIIET